MKTKRTNHLQILDDSPLVRESISDNMNKYLIDPEITFLQKTKTATKETGKHYNVFIRGIKPAQSAGSVAEYQFCKEGKPPETVYASMILNIKDEEGNKYYQQR